MVAEPLPPVPLSSRKRVFLETFGCQMNILDSELVKSDLALRGYEFVARPDDAEIVLYNTCSVRELSEHKVLSRLGIQKRRKTNEPDLVVGLLGCMAERAGKALADELPHLDVVVGPSELDRLPALLDEIARGGARAQKLALSGHNTRRSSTLDAAMDRLEALDRGRFTEPDEGSAQAYVRITRGCNKFCSFCVVPYTRGPEVHRDPDAIVDEVKRLVDAGVKEVTLLGQTINHYAVGETSFARLLQRVHDEVPALARLRFLTSYPRDFTDEALDVMASSERMCRFLHIPAQHGNDAVLKRMNRGYTRAMYLDLIARARARMPDVAIVGDMIVGFPGETDQDFEDSLSLLDAVRYKTVYVFKYSPRPGTVAERRDDDDVPDAVKRERNNIMLQRQHEISLAHHEAMKGAPVEVLVEGVAKIDPEMRDVIVDDDGSPLLTIGGRNTRKRTGDIVRLTSRTRGDHIVSFDGPASLVGSLVQVRVDAVTGLSLRGALVDGSPQAREALA
jgi:tRNA-2-methylthio-N6-dimethylallyladenosine synthase